MAKRAALLRAGARPHDPHTRPKIKKAKLKVKRTGSTALEIPSAACATAAPTAASDLFALALPSLPRAEKMRDPHAPNNVDMAEAAPAGADALDVAKAMVKEVHPGYNIIVVALDEKLVRTRAQG